MRTTAAPHGTPARSTAEARFERDGYVVLPRVLTESSTAALRSATERVVAEEQAARRLAPGDPMHLFAFIDRDPAFEGLVAHPLVLPLICSILGWNIHLYHCHLDRRPPGCAVPATWAWHQDGGRQNVDIETEPTRPRLSVKVAFLLTDSSEPGTGNTLVIPGSHRRNRLERPADGSTMPAGAVPILAPAGSALLFDRRLWHSRGPGDDRMAAFLAYTYRWIRPRDDATYSADWLARMTPVQRQLLGASTGATGHWIPTEEDVPLRTSELSGPSDHR